MDDPYDPYIIIMLIVLVWFSYLSLSHWRIGTHGNEQCSWLLVEETNSNLLMEQFLHLILKILCIMRGSVTTTLLHHGSWIPFQKKLLQVSPIPQMQQQYGRILRIASSKTMDLASFNSNVICQIACKVPALFCNITQRWNRSRKNSVSTSLYITVTVVVFNHS